MTVQNEQNTATQAAAANTTELTPDIEIARSVTPQSILLLAQQRLGLPPESLIPFGHFKAKVDLGQVDTSDTTKYGKLVLVTAVTPTPAGEGKTTTSVGLNDALNDENEDNRTGLSEVLDVAQKFGQDVGSQITSRSDSDD